jgi:hypothetical protein
MDLGDPNLDFELGESTKASANTYHSWKVAKYLGICQMHSM